MAGYVWEEVEPKAMLKTMLQGTSKNKIPHTLLTVKGLELYLCHGPIWVLQLIIVLVQGM